MVTCLDSYFVFFQRPFVCGQVGDATKADFTGKDYSGALIQYPNTYGDVNNPEAFVKKAHDVGCVCVVCVLCVVYVLSLNVLCVVCCLQTCCVLCVVFEHVVCCL